MRISTFILSLFVLSLSILPCSDAVTCDYAPVDEPVEVSTTHDHSKDQSDGCTSLCSCSCCGIQITHMGFQELDLNPAFDFGDDLSAYDAQYSFLLIQGIWHPPSLG